MNDDLLADLNQDIEDDLSGADYSHLQIGTRDWTVDTIISQVIQGNIDVNPHFQRRNAWNDAKRSRFLESLILGVPIPQLVLAEKQGTGARGTFFVIDGKQRLMTVAGLRDEQYNFWNSKKFSRLNELKQLNGIEIERFTNDPQYSGLLRQLDNWPVRCSIISGYTTDDVLYDMFYRLNSGSAPLSGQELRQVFYKGPFAAYLFAVTSNEQPIHSVLGTDVPDPRFIDIEVVLRSIANEVCVEPYGGNLKRFLDETMNVMNQSWATAEPLVERVYANINNGISRAQQIFGDFLSVGRKSERGRGGSRFNKAVFEVEIYYFSRIPQESFLPECFPRFQDLFRNLCDNREFASAIESTTKSLDRFEARFVLFRDAVNSAFGTKIAEVPQLVRRLR